MTRPQGFHLDLSLVEEPEDLWTRLFLAWVKNLEEQNAINQDRLGALEDAITQLDRAVAKLQPEQPDDLVTAMTALQDVQEVWKLQSTRSLDNVEKLAVIVNQIIARQKTG